MEKDRLGIPAYSLLTWIYPGLFLLLLFQVSCSAAAPTWNVLSGNAHYSRGDYAGATVSYMKALPQNPYSRWIYYNLGNAYSAMGEIDPAIQQLIKAGEEQNHELLYRANFNLGEIFYELGNFENAINYFKAALKAKPGDIDAKINLEISIKDYQGMLDAAGAAAGSGSQNTDAGQNWAEILTNLQQQEEKIWEQIKKGQSAPNAEDW